MEKPKLQKEKQPVSLKIYDAFVDLHFLKLDGAILKESAEKEYKDLKEQVLACGGKKPKVSKTISIKGYGIVKLAMGYPVPSEILKAIENIKATKIYF